MTDAELDKPLYGARAIGEEAGLRTPKGDVDVRAAFYALERKLIDASKFGRRWTSTPRRIRKAFMGGAK